MAIDPGLKPKLHHFKTKTYVEPHLDRAEQFLDTNNEAFFRNAAQRLDAEHVKWTTLNIKPEIVVLELLYPGDKYRKLEDKWFYVYHAGSGKMLLEGFGQQVVLPAAPGGNEDGTPTQQYNVFYRWNPTPTADHYHGLAPNEDGFTAIAVDPGEAHLIDMRVPLPPGTVTKADIDNKLIRIFVCPWRFHVGCYAQATPATTMDPKGAWVSVRNGHGGILWGVAVDPYAWAFDCKSKLYEPRLTQWDHYVKEEDRQSELFIATTLKSWTENGDRYGVENELVMPELNRWLNEYRTEELAFRTLVEEAGSYLASTCLDSPEHKLAELAAMDGGVDGATLTGMQWMTVVTGLNQCDPGRRYCLDLVADPNRYVRRQIFPDAAPFVSWDNYGTIRWLLYANWVSFGELVTSWSVWKARDGFLALSEYDRLVHYAGAVGLHLEPSKVPSIYKLDATGFEEGYARLKTVTGNLVKDGDALVHADPEGVLKIPPHSGRWKSLKWIESPSLWWKRQYVSQFHSHAKLVLDIINFGIAVQNLRKAQGGQAKTDSIISLIGSSADLSACMLEMTTAYMKKKGTGSRVYWGRLVGNARALGGVLGLVGGVCDGYDMYRKGQGAWDRDADGEWVGAAIGVAGGAASAIGGALALASYWFPVALSATGWAGPVGVALSIVGAGLLIAGAVVIIWMKQMPHEQFAIYSMFGRGRLLSKTAMESKDYDWMPNKMPCRTRGKEVENLGALFSNYIVRISGNEGERMNRAGAGPAFIDVTVGMLDHTARLEVYVEQKYMMIHDNKYQGTFWSKLMLDEISNDMTWDPAGTMRLPDAMIKRHPNEAIESWRIPLRPLWIGDQVSYEKRTDFVMWQGSVKLVMRSDNKNPPFNVTYTDHLFSDGFTTFDNDKVLK